jgi:hypothetical protein
MYICNACLMIDVVARLSFLTRLGLIGSTKKITIGQKVTILERKNYSVLLIHNKCILFAFR